MKAKKKNFAQGSKLLKFFKSKTFLVVVVTVFTLISLVLMVFLDKTNEFRQALYGNQVMKEIVLLDNGQRKLLPMLWPITGDFMYEGDINAVANFVTNILGIPRVDFEMNAWGLLFGVLGTIWFILILSYVYDRFEPVLNEFYSRRFYHEKTIDKMSKITYYALLLFVCGAVIGAFTLAGVFVGPFDGDIFDNFLIMLLAAVGFTAVVIAAILAVTLLLIFIFYVVGIVVSFLAKNTYSKYDEYVSEHGGAGSLGENGELGTVENPVNALIESIDGSGGAGGGGGFGDGSIKLEHVEQDVVTDVARLFPALNAIDQEEALADHTLPPMPRIDPKDFVIRFQAYLCRKHKLYYELPLLRSFLAGLASSRILILEGLSGTGKSMLPRMFGEFIDSKTFFCPVQATWRDRTDIVGYYSDFTNEFKETEFLKRLYKMNYHQSSFNLMVLDEMNISRIEYYFADFLSILEYPPSDWLVKLLEIKEGQEMPKKLEGGNVRIPRNTWFIGTANTDDSTFTITDKVYDRATIIDFKEKNSPIKPIGSGAPLKGFRVEQMYGYFREAYKNPELALNEQENEKFIALCDLAFELFDIRFGNRILNQINNFIPVYVLFGGTKEEAIDFMFARKVIRKLEGKFDDYIKDGLLKMQKEIRNIYGRSAFDETYKYIKKLLKKFY